MTQMCNGIMVSGGIYKDWGGNVNSFAFKQGLKFYKEDLKIFESKLFKQYGASSHSSKFSKNIINALFKNKLYLNGNHDLNIMISIFLDGTKISLTFLQLSNLINYKTNANLISCKRYG